MLGTPYLDAALVLQSGYLNGENNIGVAKALNTDGLWPNDGLLGKIVCLGRQEALAVSDTTVGTLRGGKYQLVKAVTALARGDIVAWDVTANAGLADFEVTHTIAATLEGYLAGIALNTVTINQYCWIQIAGLAGVKFRAAVTDKTAGNIVLQLTTTATADAIADGTGTYISGGTKGLKNIIGAAYEAPTDGGVNLVVLKNIHENFG